MASGSGPAGTVAVEVVADLTKLDAGLSQAQTRARAAGSQIAGDLGKVESAAKGAGAADAAASIPPQYNVALTKSFEYSKAAEADHSCGESGAITLRC